MCKLVWSTLMSRRSWLFGIASALIVSALSGMASTSLAETINIDIGHPDVPDLYVGTAVAPDAGTVWNPISATGTSGALVSSTGGATGVTFTLGTASTNVGFNNAGGLGVNALMRDYTYGYPQANTFSINGLTPGGTYDLYLYAQNGSVNAATTQFTIGATSQTATNAAGNLTSFVELGNYVKFLGLIATGGSISGSVVDPNSVPGVDERAFAFNGLQVQSVPEPSSLLILATGVVGLVACARQRKSSV